MAGAADQCTATWLQLCSSAGVEKHQRFKLHESVMHPVLWQFFG